MIPAIPLPWKIAGALGAVLLIVLAIGGAYLKGRSDGEGAVEAAVAKATLEAKKKADALSDELVIQQAIAMGTTQKKAGSYVQQVRSASDDADRMRVGSRGVHSLIRGGADPAVGGPSPAVPGPGAGR